MIYVNSVTTYPSSITIKKGHWYYGASVQVCPENATCAGITWSSSNTSVATVNSSSGYIYAKSAGTARIYATATDGSGEYDYIFVTVTDDILVDSVTVTPSYKVMTVGDSTFLHESVCPENATNKAVFWCSSNENIATVNPTSGLVTAKGVGTATIYATAQDGSGERGSCDIRVKAVLVCSVEIDQKDLTIHSGTIHDMTVTVLPANATNKAVKWYSDNTSIAGVGLNGGILRGRELGKTFIRAVSQDGSNITDCCAVTVIPPIPVKSVTVSPAQKTLDIGEKIELTTTIAPEDATFKDVIWSSSDPNIATVDEETGEVTGISDGTATIIAESVDSCVAKGYCTIRVDSRERVLIEKDGDYFTVKFSNNHTWKSISCDMSLSENRSKIAMWDPENYNLLFEHERRYIFNVTQPYTIEEIAFLFLYDPMGIIYYMKHHTSSSHDTLADILFFKDQVYKQIFGKDPRLIKVFPDKTILYFKYPSSISASTREDYYSDAEVLFGEHMIYDLISFIAFLVDVVPKVGLSLFGTLWSTFGTVLSAIELCNLLFFSSSITDFISNGVSSTITDYVESAYGDGIKNKFNWAGFLLDSLGAVIDGLDVFMPSINDITIYNKINVLNFQSRFLVEGKEFSMNEIIEQHILS